MNEPTVRQLRYLVALAEELHFGEAAARCDVSQPALSSQLRELERNLGAQLVERNPRSVLLTSVGEAVVERARRVLAEVDDIVDIANVQNDPFTGRLRMGVIPTIAPYVLPRVLPAVRKTYPNLELHLVEDFTDRLMHRLQQGELDIALVALPIEESNMHAEPLITEPFVMLTPADHALAGETRINPKRMDASDLLLLQEGHCLRNQALDVCHLNGRGRHPLVEGSSLAMLIQMVANGLGTTLLPLIATTVDLPSKAEVRAIPFTRPTPGRDLGLVWRAGAGRNDAYRELAALLRTEMTRLLRDADKSLAKRKH